MRKKKAKRTPYVEPKRPPPPLSALDHTIYVGLLLLACAPLALWLVAVVLLSDPVAYADPSVLISARSPVTALWIILLLFTVEAPLLVSIAVAWACRQPFFGREGERYGVAGGREPIYPLFGKRRPPKGLIRIPNQQRILAVVMAVTVIPLTLLFSIFSIYGRSHLHEDLSVTVRNGLNVETRHYSAEDIESASFALTRHRGRSLIPGYQSWVTVTMKDGRFYEFSADPIQLLCVKERLPSVPVTYRMGLSVEEYARKAHLSQREIDALRRIFHQNESSQD